MFNLLYTACLLLIKRRKKNSVVKKELFIIKNKTYAEKSQIQSAHKMMSSLDNFQGQSDIINE